MPTNPPVYMTKPGIQKRWPVSLAAFVQRYQPAGWVLDEDTQADAVRIRAVEFLGEISRGQYPAWDPVLNGFAATSLTDELEQLGFFPGGEGEGGGTNVATWNFRGDYQANTAYAAGDTVRGVGTLAGGLYLAPAPFTSGASFSAANWQTLIPPLSGEDWQLAADVGPYTNDTTWHDVAAWSAEANGLYKADLTVHHDTVGPATPNNGGIRFRFVPLTGMTISGTFRGLNPGAGSYQGGHVTLPVRDMANGVYASAGMHGVTAQTPATAVDVASCDFVNLRIKNGSTAGVWKLQASQAFPNATAPGMTVLKDETHGTVVRVA